MDYPPSYSLRIAQLDLNKKDMPLGFVPGTFDEQDPKFAENRSKHRNDPATMKKLKDKAALIPYNPKKTQNSPQKCHKTHHKPKAQGTKSRPRMTTQALRFLKNKQSQEIPPLNCYPSYKFRFASSRERTLVFQMSRITIIIN
ncbi:hypothetical protein FXO37_29238 [Capsicum annuum]|nr:hypothetical protein FXO37_29238 [Capsicum annuum]